MVTARALTPADLRAFARAALLARRAQRVVEHPVAQVVEDMVSRRGPVHDLPVERLIRATTRATSRIARWCGGRDTCLIRSLVLGTLLSPRGQVVLTIGFRPGDLADVPDGHAWLTLDGRPVGPGAATAVRDFTSTLRVSFADIDPSGGEL
jgi:hypothetical protein